MSDLVKAALYVSENSAAREANYSSGNVIDRQFEMFAKMLADFLLRSHAPVLGNNNAFAEKA